MYTQSILKIIVLYVIKFCYSCSVIHMRRVDNNTYSTHRVIS